MLAANSVIVYNILFLVALCEIKRACCIIAHRRSSTVTRLLSERARMAWNRHRAMEQARWVWIEEGMAPARWVRSEGGDASWSNGAAPGVSAVQQATEHVANQKGQREAKHLCNVRLCLFHVDGRCRKGDTCFFAHRLKDLRAPYEYEGNSWSNVWNEDKVDKWFGSSPLSGMRRRERSRILTAYFRKELDDASPQREIPDWAYAYAIVHLGHRPTKGPACGEIDWGMHRILQHLAFDRGGTMPPGIDPRLGAIPLEKLESAYNATKEAMKSWDVGSAESGEDAESESQPSGSHPHASKAAEYATTAKKATPKATPRATPKATPKAAPGSTAGPSAPTAQAPEAASNFWTELDTKIELAGKCWPMWHIDAAYVDKCWLCGWLPRRTPHNFEKMDIKSGSRIDFYRGVDSDDRMNSRWVQLLKRLPKLKKRFVESHGAASDESLGGVMEIVTGIAYAVETEGIHLPYSRLVFSPEDSARPWQDVWDLLKRIAGIPPAARKPKMNTPKMKLKMIEAENEAVGLRFFDQPAVSAPNYGQQSMASLLFSVFKPGAAAPNYDQSAVAVFESGAAGLSDEADSDDEARMIMLTGLGASQQRGMNRNTLHDLAEEELPYDAIARRAEILLYDEATLRAIARRGERLRAEGHCTHAL